MRRTLTIAGLVALAMLVGAGAWLLASDREAMDPQATLREDAAAGVAPLPLAVDAPSVPEALGELASEAETSPPEASGVAASNPDLPAPFAFRGRVVDDVGLPIAGATVVYWPNEVSGPLYGLEDFIWSGRSVTDALPRVLTSRDGRFEVPGRWLPGLARNGGDEDPQLVVIADGYTIRARNCRLYPGGDIDVGDIAVEPEGWVEGRLVDARGRPVAGAEVRPWNPRCYPVKVELDGMSNPGALTTVFAATLSGADGSFRVDGLWEGKVQLGIKAEGFLDRWIDDHQPVTAGRATDLGELVLDAGALLSGQVRDEAGGPIAGARLVALSSYRTRAWWSPDEDDGIVFQLARSEEDVAVCSDAEGRFVVPGLAATNHSVLVTAPGFDPLCVDDVLPGGRELDIVLEAAASLRLLVTSRAGGQPIDATEVRARRCGSKEPGASAIDLPVLAGDVPGAFVVSGLGRACTRVTVSAPGHASRSLVLEGCTPPERVERAISLAPESSLAGRVLADDGMALPAAELRLRRAAEQEWVVKPVPVPLSADGRFEVRGLEAGEWMLVADAPDRSPVVRSETLQEGDVRMGVDVTLPRAAEVFGTCTKADGAPEAGAYRTFERLTDDGLGPQEREIRTDEAGRYELRDLPAGRWKVSFGEPPLELELADGQQLQVDMRSPAPTVVEGRVLRADGTPVPGAWVFTIPLHLPPQVAYRNKFPHQADPGGRWSVEGLHEGALLLIATVPGGAASAPVHLDLLSGERRTVDLVLGQGRVTGTVATQEGEAVAGADVYVTPVSENDQPLTHTHFGIGGDEWDFGAATDAEGRFEMGDLAAGRYQAHVSVKGFEAEKQAAFELTSSTPVELKFTVIRMARIHGTVTLASGVPIHEGLYVTAAGPQGKQSAEVEVGRYDLSGLMPGTWSLSIRDDGRLIAERTVVVEAGQEVIADLVATP